MKLRVFAAGIILALCLSTAGLCSAAEPEAEPDVRILNADTLSKADLAEATAAKGLILMEPDVLGKAASLEPDNSRYWYYLAAIQHMQYSMIPSFIEERESTIAPSILDSISKALKADPKYLPALYLDAVFQPTYSKRVHALKQLAALDKNNAKPCYLMALMEYDDITEGRQFLEESDRTAHWMSAEEWESVVELVKQGNQRPEFSATFARLPSTANIRITVDGNQLPDDAVESLLVTGADTIQHIGDEYEFAPLSFVIGARARGLARQASWQAHELAANGRLNPALDTLQVLREFGTKYASSSPYRASSFLIGSAIRRIASARLVELLGDSDRAAALRQSDEKWKDAVRTLKSLTESTTKTANGVPYGDYAAEEAGVKAALEELGVIK